MSNSAKKPEFTLFVWFRLHPEADLYAHFALFGGVQLHQIA
ncbi:MAG: hypothetical protein WCK31_00535 [bacterium]